MSVTAPSVRSGYDPDAEQFAKQQVARLMRMLSKADKGDLQARDDLESELLHLQSTRYTNPFVSCSRYWSVAQGFATYGDTPGYVLTIEGEGPGLDISAVRARHQMFGDAVDHLAEFGIPEALGENFQVVTVHRVQSHGQPSEVVFP
ncbi:hypothetical protein ACIQPR_44120 [Streptomyces sp. NPDC091280]|uniref:hypothetical protein n=1 Tax=Streptomyces sp. NPDC091280 TaxID=3365984 RepID=UPI0038198AF3